jgi:Ca-activated chloride channel family protein
MAEALGWPKTTLSLRSLLNGDHPAAAGWAAVGRPEWGEFRLGMADPLRSTASLHALLAMLDTDGDTNLSEVELGNAATLSARQKVYQETTDRLFATLRVEDGRGSDAALHYVSAFPALEQEVSTYNAGNPRVPLVALYPSDGGAEADHPYVVLNASWSDGRRQAAARSFLDYVRGPNGRERFQAVGFRDPDRVAGKPLTPANGTLPQVTAESRAVPPTDAIKRAVERWTALTRPTNVLLVLDISGSMNEKVPGTDRTRLALVREAAKETVKTLPDDTQVGLWLFATRLDGSRDYRQAVSIGALDSPEADTPHRRDALLSALDAMTATGNCGLYDTAVAAQKAVADNFRTGATNLVVLVSDGHNEDDTGGLSLDQARDALGGGDRATRVPVVTVALGRDADLSALRELSRASGAATFASPTGADLESVLLSAVLGRV